MEWLNLEGIGDKKSVLCSWHKSKRHICLHHEPSMEWLNLEGIVDKRNKK
jgi:hypothetical protein